jgi:hypothetical protein
MDIRRTQTQLAMPFLDEQAVRIPRLEVPDDLRRAIRRAVVYNQNMKTLVQSKNSLKNIGNILLFVVSRYDDDLFQMPVNIEIQKYNFQNECPGPPVPLSLF